MRLQVEQLIKINNPMKDGCWLTGHIPNWMVHKRLRENRLINIPVYNYSTPWIHAGRIAFLVKNDWHDKILIDVGIGGDIEDGRWIIYDGNHRLAAAYFKGDKSINCELCGEISLITKLIRMCNENSRHN